MKSQTNWHLLKMSLYNMINWQTLFKNKIYRSVDNFISYQMIYMPPWLGKYFWANFDFIVRVFTREISSRHEIRPGTKSSLSIVKNLLLFTRFSRDETSFQDELIPVRVRLYVTETKFIPQWNSSRDEKISVYMWVSSRDEILLVSI